MTDAEQREAARQFINRWKNGGDEKQQCHLYWIELLQNVLGIENPTRYTCWLFCRFAKANLRKKQHKGKCTHYVRPCTAFFFAGIVKLSV